MRLFISVELPEDVKSYLEEIQSRLKTKGNIRWAKPENMHLTLKFLGDVDDGKLEKLKEKLSGINFGGFKLTLDKLGMFGSRILWIDVLENEAFDLHKTIDASLSDLFEQESKFASHITIARIKHLRNKKEFVDKVESVKFERVSFNVNSFFLMQSQLLADGPVYSVIEEYKLKE